MAIGYLHRLKFNELLVNSKGHVPHLDVLMTLQVAVIDHHVSWTIFLPRWEFEVTNVTTMNFWTMHLYFMTVNGTHRLERFLTDVALVWSFFLLFFCRCCWGSGPFASRVMGRNVLFHCGSVKDWTYCYNLIWGRHWKLLTNGEMVSRILDTLVSSVYEIFYDVSTALRQSMNYDIRYISMVCKLYFLLVLMIVQC